MHIFETIDKTGRNIRLTKKQFSHIMKRHPMMINYLEEIQQTLKNPLKITSYNLDLDVWYYYQYLKSKPGVYKYLLVIVKYLNGEGSVVSSFFDKKIK